MSDDILSLLLSLLSLSFFVITSISSNSSNDKDDNVVPSRRVVVVVVGIREYGTCDLERRRKKKKRTDRIWKEIRTGDLPCTSPTYRYVYVFEVS